MKYRAEIDGLRAVAVLPVIFFHAGFSLFSGGYIGVDVFFVISGYLITAIILADLEQDTFSLVKFYERRARRILPALFFVVICCIPFAWAWMAPQEFKDFSQGLFAISIFSSNILFWRKSGYFGAAAEENPLLHTWSLAVEEQFYIFFPIMILLLWRFGKRPIFFSVLLLSFMSLCLTEYAWRNHPSANFFLLPTRAWELGVGAICAFLLHQRKTYQSSSASLLGLGLIAFSIFVFDETTPFPSLYTFIPVIGTALVILYADNKTLTARIISNKLFVGIGLISFSAYLWHQPLFAFTRIRSPDEPGLLLMGGLSLVSLLLAALTWKFIEQPFRKKTGYFAFSRKQIFTFSSLGTAFLIITGMYVHIQNGIESRTAPSGKSFAELKMSERTKPNRGLHPECTGEFKTTKKCRTGENPTIMVWGDSFAMHLVQAVMSSESLGTKEIIQFTKSSCPPLLGISKLIHNESWAKGCIKFNNEVMEWLARNQTIEYVIISTPMNIIHSQTLNEQGKINAPSTELVMESAKKVAAFIKSSGRKIVFVSPPPRSGRDLSKCSIYNLTFGTGDNFNCDFAVADISEKHNEVINFIKSNEFPMPVLDLSNLICDNSVCKTFSGGANIYRDAGHLSVTGSEYLGKRHDFLSLAITASENSISPVTNLSVPSSAEVKFPEYLNTLNEVGIAPVAH